MDEAIINVTSYNAIKFGKAPKPKFGWLVVVAAGSIMRKREYYLREERWVWGGVKTCVDCKIYLAIPNIQDSCMHACRSTCTLALRLLFRRGQRVRL